MRGRKSRHAAIQFPGLVPKTWIAYRLTIDSVGQASEFSYLLDRGQFSAFATGGEEALLRYEDVIFKVPHESADYAECSEFVVTRIEAILKRIIEAGKNKIVINTNLRLGLPMENINKVAGPFVEAWAVEVFHDISEDSNNEYELVNVEAKERLYMADIILQFKKRRKIDGIEADSSVTAEVDVKATAEDFKDSGKSPNITSFARIRTAYIEDPDYIFAILSLKHRVYSKRNDETTLMDGVMEVVEFNAYDLKYLSSADRWLRNTNG